MKPKKWSYAETEAYFKNNKIAVIPSDIQMFNMGRNSALEELSAMPKRKSKRKGIKHKIKLLLKYVEQQETENRNVAEKFEQIDNAFRHELIKSSDKVTMIYPSSDSLEPRSRGNRKTNMRTVITLLQKEYLRLNSMSKDARRQGLIDLHDDIESTLTNVLVSIQILKSSPTRETIKADKPTPRIDKGFKLCMTLDEFDQIMIYFKLAFVQERIVDMTAEKENRVVAINDIPRGRQSNETKFIITIKDK